MLSLPGPVRNSESDYDLASSSRRKTNRAILAGLRDTVMESYRNYSGRARMPELNHFDDDDAEKLRENYNLTYHKGSLSALRQEIFEISTYCALCGAEEASTLDHYLPQESFPEFSIFAHNLLPACDRCNRKKSTRYGFEDTGRFAHPYLDDLKPNGAILDCAFAVEQDIIHAMFNVKHSLPEAVQRIAVYHFDKLELGGRYSAKASMEIIEDIGLYEEAYELGGAQLVASEARRKRNSLLKKFPESYWKVALYRGIETSDVFCDGGFRMAGSLVAFE
ncbi:HNH endonuclease [Nocardia fluminea]